MALSAPAQKQKPLSVRDAKYFPESGLVFDAPGKSEERKSNTTFVNPATKPTGGLQTSQCDIITSQPQASTNPASNPAIPDLRVNTSLYANSNMVGTHFKVGKRIGEGSFGVIYEGVNVVTGQPVAIKFESRKSEAPQLKDESRSY
ncbi:hypothetical protein HDU82_007087 [Entophlyctis luteolus]|nr:hypothetical protein HDU82_007087 [Entophlyctis luteolus]